MILGRESEVNYLNMHFDQDDSRIMVVYGEKNVGKTALLHQFVRDKSFYYYCAKYVSLREQRYQWGAELKKKGIRLPEYPEFTDIFKSLMGNEKKKKVIIVDEFQNMVKAGDEFIRQLIWFVHEIQASCQVMIVLCSSSIGWVENNMVTKIGEAAYELSGLLKIRALGFETLREYFAGFSMEQSIEAYAVLGGMPGLLKQFDDKLSIKENICRYILNRNAFLYEEGQRIAAQELRDRKSVV